MLLLGLIVAVSVHIIGALLVMALLVTPAAAAMRIATGPVSVPLLAAVFGFVSAVGGILLAIAGTLPVSPYITTISFVIYVVCRVIGSRAAIAVHAHRASAMRSPDQRPIGRIRPWLERNTWQRERVREALARRAAAS